MKKKTVVLFFLFSIFNSVFAEAQLPTGMWRATLTLNDSTELPFNFEVIKRHDSTLVEIINAKERIEMNDLTLKGDSLIMHSPFFDSEIRAKLSDNRLTGSYINYARKKDNVISFSAQRNLRYRFHEHDSSSLNITGRYLVQFASDDAESKNSIGEFVQKGRHVEGTILTTSGDDRYLEGTMQGHKLFLSCFDDSHAFLFMADCKKDGSMKGDYYSGKHFHDTWIAMCNDTVHLPDPSTFAALKKGVDHFEFSFPDADSNMISFPNDTYKNKVVILQIMGTWCPNCLDETMFLSKFYKDNKARGVEIVALDFERIPELKKASANIKRLQHRLDIQYPVLFAGGTSQEEKEKAIPQLTRIFSFPTTIFIDKHGKVRKIDSGYTGPATNEHYTAFVKEFNSVVTELLNEN